MMVPSKCFGMPRTILGHTQSQRKGIKPPRILLPCTRVPLTQRFEQRRGKISSSRWMSSATWEPNDGETRACLIKNWSSRAPGITAFFAPWFPSVAVGMGEKVSTLFSGIESSAQTSSAAFWQLSLWRDIIDVGGMILLLHACMQQQAVYFTKDSMQTVCNPITGVKDTPSPRWRGQACGKILDAFERQNQQSPKH